MWFIYSLLGLIFTVLFHSIYTRVLPQRNRVLSFLKIGILVGFTISIVNSINYGFFSIPQFASVISYAFACELYIFLFTFSLASISANILVTMRLGPSDVEEIESLYDSKEMVSKRFNRLISSGLLKPIDSQSNQALYQITPRGSRFVRIINFLRLVFNH